MLIAAIYELATGNIIRNLLCLSELPGQRPLPSCHHLKGECLRVLPLSRVVVGQVLCHGVALVICSDRLLMRINPSMSREPRLPSVPLGADRTDPGVVCPSSEMTRARLLHAAVWVEAAREVRPGQDGAKGGPALLHDLDV